MKVLRTKHSRMSAVFFILTIAVAFAVYIYRLEIRSGGDRVEESGIFKEAKPVAYSQNDIIQETHLEIGQNKQYLELELLGTIVKFIPLESIAVIRETESLRQRVCKVEDKVLGYQIVEILRGRVVLLKEGKRYFLNLPDGGNADLVTVISSDKRIINRRVLAQEIKDINNILRQVLPVPYIDSGKIKGIKLAKIKNKDLAQKAGIKEGDIITKVNGYKLDSVRKPFSIYYYLRNEDLIELEINRAGQAKTMFYYMN